MIKLKNILIWGGLLATVSTTLYLSTEDPAEDIVVAKKSKSKTNTEVKNPGQVVSIDPMQVKFGFRPNTALSVGWDIFSDPPPPPPPPVVVPPPAPPPPPPKPVAPPLPFKVVGRLLDAEGVVSAYLAKGEKALVVKAGDSLGDDYQVLSISDSEIKFKYKPLNETQSLQFLN